MSSLRLRSRLGSSPAPKDHATAHRGWKPFVEFDPELIHRRIGDIAILTFSFIGVALLSARAGDVADWQVSLAETFMEAPSWLSSMFEFVYHLGSIWAVVGLALAAVVGRRWRLGRDLLVAGGLAWLAARILALTVGASESTSVGDIFTSSELPTFPMVRLAVTTAVVTTAMPYLVRPLRRLGAGVIVVMAAASLAVPAGYLVDLGAALLVGIGAAAAVHLAFGSPRGRPSVATVVDTLSSVGVEVVNARLADVQSWGGVHVIAETTDGRRIDVKAYGEDAEEAQLLTRLWRVVWYRNTEFEIMRTGTDHVNDEALVTLLAERAGVSVPDVVTTGPAGGAVAVYGVTIDPGRLLDDLTPEEITDDLLDELWAQAERLHRANLSHGRLDGRHIVVSTSGVQLVELANGRTPANGEDIDLDRAVLLMTTGCLVGPERAAAAALRGSTEAALAAVPYLQMPALDADARVKVRGYDKARPDGDPRPPKLLDGLRTAILTATHTDAPEPVKLQRVTWKQAAIAVGTVIAVWALLSQLGDIQGVGEELKSADLWWVLAGLLLGLLPAVTDAMATLGAIAQPLPLGPAVVLQYSQKFTNLAVPSTVGCAAISARFFMKQGVALAKAVSAGLLVSVGGFVVQIFLVIVCVLLTSTSLQLSDTGGGGIGTIVLLAIIGAGIAVTVLAFAPKLRTRLWKPVKAALGDVKTVLSSPRKFFTIIGGNMASQVTYALVLDCSLHAYGWSLPLPELILVNTGTTFITGIVPVPGGMGVAEAALTAGLTAFGVPPPTAAAAALTHRLVTFYLPPIWGWFAFRWLTRHDYL